MKKEKFIISEKQLKDVAKTYPKYGTFFLNKAADWSQATRARNIGNLSQLYLQFGGSTKEEWEEYVIDNLPKKQSIINAKNKMKIMLNNFKKSLRLIDDEIILNWLEDLIFQKSFKGLDLQQRILERVSNEMGCEYRTANAQEESKNIDGFICDEPVSIKPFSFKKKGGHGSVSDINIPIIYYLVDNENQLHIKHNLNKVTT